MKSEPTKLSVLKLHKEQENNAEMQKTVDEYIQKKDYFKELMKHRSEVLHSYYEDLKKSGFTPEEAMQIITSDKSV